MRTQFKSFLFPHAPASITVERGPRLAAFFCPGHGEVVQPLGEGGRVVKLEGCLLAASPAASQAMAEQWSAATADPSPGVLILPGLPPITAALERCVFHLSGDGSCLPYTIHLREVRAEG